jgi:iron(III) transport system substrate-binding protein
MKMAPGKKRVFKVVLAGAAIVTLAVTLAGCGQAANTQAASKPKQLVLYSAQGYDAAMAKAFQAKTGIQVKLSDMSTGPLIGKIEAEKSNSHWDVAWFDGDASMQELDNEGLLLKGWTPNDVSNLTPLGRSLVAPDKSYYPGGVTAAAAIGVNTKLLPKAEYPKDWKDLLNPTFKNAVAMNDPSISGPTYPFVAGILNLMGNTRGKKFFLEMKANGMKVGRTNNVELNGLLTGQYKAVMIQDSALVSAKAKGEPINIIYPSSGVFTLPDVLGINKNAPDMAAAKEFVEYVLSREGQKVMSNPRNGGGDSYYNPVVTGIKPNAARQQSGINWKRVDPVASAKDENSIKKWFNDNITQ